MEFLKVFRGETLLWTQCAYENSFFFRCKGLLGKKRLNDDEALWLKPCNSIHMFFMKFPIDAIFLDRENRIVRIIHGIKPWGITPLIWDAYSTLEVPAGSSSHHGLKEGDQLRFLT